MESDTQESGRGKLPGSEPQRIESQLAPAGEAADGRPPAEQRNAAPRARTRPCSAGEGASRSQERLKGRLRPFQPGEPPAEPEAPDGLQGEIAMLRMLIHRVLDLSRGVDDLDQAMDLLEGMSKAAARLANMLKVQVVLQREGSSDLAQSISQALAEVMQEMGLK